jgi:hypothetical protein
VSKAETTSTDPERVRVTDQVERQRRPRGPWIAIVIGALFFASVLAIALRPRDRKAPVPVEHARSVEAPSPASPDRAVPSAEIPSDDGSGEQPVGARDGEAGGSDRPAPGRSRRAPTPQIDPADPGEPGGPPPTRPDPPSARELADMYAEVGRELRDADQTKGLAATADLLPRYRWIRLNDALATPDKRRAAYTMLEQIRADLRTR